MKSLIVHGHTNIKYELSQDTVDRLELAIILFKSGQYEKVILTGGLFISLQGGVPIAEAMKKYLIDKGIPERVIEVELNSLTTIHNVEMLKDVFGDVVTSDYHALRTRLIWRLVGRKKIRVFGAHSTSKITLKKRVVELVGILVTIAYWIHIKFPEMIFREIARKI